MRYLTLAAAVCLTGCAGMKSTVSAPDEELRSVVRLHTARGVRDLELTRRTFDQPRFVRMQWDAGLAALPAVYEQLGIPSAAMLNQDDQLFGRRYMRTRHSLGGVRMSRYLNCGSTFVAGPDTYELTLTVMTTLRPTGGGSMVRTWVDATGRDPAGSGTQPVQCSSTGLLEREIVRLLNSGGAPPASSVR
ncbi:MAG TPA: hypothetical protein VF665_20225 [Longimicrobium sp.]|jgi:hypothetical protein|uniref:hypothetical protein n=1 Tax=Longimicrobium sp. TaxID=2029185 RepID=UPI002ED8A51A